MKSKGAVPVKVNVTSGWVAPAQIDPPPLVTAVGNGLTITETGLPRLELAQPVLSLSAVIEYVPAGAFVIVKVVEG